MILKLSGADFSANNLGVVQVQQDLLPYTEAAILASGNSQMTGPQKSALDKLFRAMGADGSNNVMSKMRKMYLPILCGGDVTKAMINYADSSYPNDKELDATKWIYRSHGIVGLVGSGNSIYLTLSQPLLTNNFSCFVLRTEKMESGVADASYGIVLRGKTNTGRFLGISSPSNSSDQLTSLGAYGVDWYPGGWSKINDAVKTSTVNFGTNGCDVCGIGTWLATKHPSSYTDMSAESSQTLYVFGLNNMNTEKAYGVAIIGEAVTLEQAKLITQRIDELYDAFNV